MKTVARRLGMGNKKIIILVALTSLVSVVWSLQNTSDHKVLFEKAKFAMETKGDLQGAIRIFQEIIAKYPQEKEYAARAQFYIGACYEKLGNIEAIKAYELVLKKYADQPELVVAARERLAVLRQEKGDKEFRIRRVAANPENVYLGSPSPDGRYLICQDLTTGDLAIQNILTGEVRKLTDKGPLSKSMELLLFGGWSPDGKRIAYAWVNKSLLTDLRLVDVANPNPKILCGVADHYIFGPVDWSPDGRQILAVSAGPTKDMSFELVLISPLDGAKRTIKALGKSPNSVPSMESKMLFSKDGRAVIYDFPAKEGATEKDIFWLNIDDGRVIPLIQHPANEVLLGLTPDRTGILFTSDRLGTKDMWKAEVVDGKVQGEPTLVKKNIGDIAPLGMTNGGAFYYETNANIKDIYTAKIDSDKGEVLGPPAKLSQITSNISQPSFSPDGKFLAYQSAREAGPGGQVKQFVCIRNMESGEERELHPDLSGFNTKLRWSPDGHAIMVGASDTSDRYGLFRMDVQSGRTSLLIQTSVVESTIDGYAWAPDGKSIYYGLNMARAKEKVGLLLKRDLQTGQEKEIHREPWPNGVRNVQISPDGKYLSFVAEQLEQETEFLKVLPVEGGTPRDLYTIKGIDNWTMFHHYAWVPNSKQILIFKYVRSGKKTNGDLWRISLDGTEPKKMSTIALESPGFLAVHPDGKSIAFLAGQLIYEVWAMENFLPQAKPDK